jgi:hypothetical protein
MDVGDVGVRLVALVSCLGAHGELVCRLLKEATPLDCDALFYGWC